MAKRGWYTYDIGKKAGLVFSLRTAIMKVIASVDACDPAIQAMPRVFEMKETGVRLDRLRQEIMSNTTGRLNLRVGDVQCLRRLSVATYPELIDVKHGISHADIRVDDTPPEYGPDKGMMPLYEEARRHIEADNGKIASQLPMDCDDND